MKIEHLQYFLAMSGSKSLSEAAGKAVISQQGYGKVIAMLEKAFGCTLVKRNAKGASLTEEGKLLMHWAEIIVSAYDQARSSLRLRLGDLTELHSFSGNVAFSNVCATSFGPLLMEDGLLENAARCEMALDAALELADNPDWICLCDVSPQVYPDWSERWSIDMLGIGRVGIISPIKLMGGDVSGDALTLASKIPIGVYDCYATREIYPLLFGDLGNINIKMRTTNDKLLKDGLFRGDFALLSDTFNWEEIHSDYKRGENRLVFAPFAKEITSYFGFVRAKGLPYGKEQQRVVDALKRMYAYRRRFTS